jgi:hypothetical protein
MAKDKSSQDEMVSETQDIQDDLIKAITTDENAGAGGSYTYDPTTKNRTKNPPEN